MVTNPLLGMDLWNHCMDFYDGTDDHIKHIHPYIYIHVYILYVCIYIYICVYMYIYIYYVYIYTSIYHVLTLAAIWEEGPQT